MPAFRCSICSIDWPQLDKYKRCEGCGGKTSPVSNIDALEKPEAKSMWCQLRFENLYDEDKPVASDPSLDERFTIEKWRAEVDEARRAQAEKDAQAGRSPVKHVLPSPNPGFRLRTPT